MNKQRAHVSFDDDIDITELVSTPSPKTTKAEKITIDSEAKKAGFTSRQPKMGRPRRSPYTAQFGGKCREGMKPLFQKIGERLDCHDTVTLELAILALIETEKLEDLKAEYKKLTNG